MRRTAHGQPCVMQRIAGACRSTLTLAVMSDNYLRYVPIEPQFQPAPSAASKAEILLGSFLPEAESVHAEFSESVEFIDAGENWSGVHCPCCGADAEAWWGDAMSSAAGGNFESLEATAQCCSAKVSLNELRYVWPVAFGRFVLEAENPNSSGLSAQQLIELGRAIGCAVREVPARI